MMLNDSGTIGFSLNAKSFPAPVVAKLGDWVEVQLHERGPDGPPDAPPRDGPEGHRQGWVPGAPPYDADTILVGPGERYTVLVHADDPGTRAWHCHILNHAENEQRVFGMVTALVVNP